MNDLHRAVRKIDKQGEDKDEKIFDPRFDSAASAIVVYESSVERLPDSWFGYNSVDLIVLSTESRPFLKELNNSPKIVCTRCA